MKSIHWLTGFVFSGIIGLLVACDKDTGINFFTLQQDIEFGEQMDSIIRANPAEYPILDPTQNAEAYAFMVAMRDEILKSDEFVHKDDFEFKMTIIDKDILNAFAVPGGNLYFYTGLMKYLDNSASLAGVLGHEMAHADRRHSTEQMTKNSEVAILINVLAGKDKSQLEDIVSGLASGLTSLSFSRKHENESDEFSVRYLAETKYHPLGISGFFEKLSTGGQSAETAEFLSTHPSDENRIENINAVWESLGNPEGEYYEAEYQLFKNELP